MRTLAICLLWIALAADARAQFMAPGGLPGFGGMGNPFGGSYGLGGQGDMRALGGYGMESQDQRAQENAFFGGFHTATRSKRSGAALLHGMALSKRRGAGAPGLLGAKATGAALPPELVAGLASGPLTEEQARSLVSAVIAADIGRLTAGGAIPGASAATRRTLAPTSDPQVAALQEKLDALVPDPAGATPDLPPRTLDQDAVKSWFDAVDVSKDRTITFLEWRDRTGLGLALFRKIDESSNGLIEFDEFARALVLNAAGTKRSVDPALLEWATTPPPKAGGEPEDTRKAADLVPPQNLDEMLARARALIAGAALEHATQAAGATTAAGTKGAATGKAATAKPKSDDDLFGLLRAGKGSKGKPAPKPRAPLPMPVPSPDAGNH